MLCWTKGCFREHVWPVQLCINNPHRTGYKSVERRDTYLCCLWENFPLTFIYPRQCIRLAGGGGEGRGASKQKKQLLQIEHNITKTLNGLQANKLAFNKPGRGFERTRGFLSSGRIVPLICQKTTLKQKKNFIPFSVIYFYGYTQT